MKVVSCYLGLFLMYIGLRSMKVLGAPTPTPTIDVLKGAPETYQEDCHKDKKLPWNAKENYVDCRKDPVMVRSNKLSCCVTDGVPNCCDPDDKFPGDANIIWSLMGIIFGILMIVVFLYNWCDSTTFPCLAKHQDRIDRIREIFMFYLTCRCLRSKKEDDEFIQAGEPRKNEEGMEQTGHIPEDDFTPYTYSNAVY